MKEEYATKINAKCGGGGGKLIFSELRRFLIMLKRKILQCGTEAIKGNKVISEYDILRKKRNLLVVNTELLFPIRFPTLKVW